VAELTFQTQDGQTVKDGDEVTLTLAKGNTDNGDYSEHTLTGIVRAFEHVEYVYDDKGIATGQTSETRWEISTNDPQHPAIGIVTENVLTRSGK